MSLKTKQQEEVMTALERLSHDTFYRMGDYSQLVIDQVQEIEDDIEEMTEDQRGSKLYQLGNILEVIDPVRIHDIEAVRTLIKILSDEPKN